MDTNRPAHLGDGDSVVVTMTPLRATSLAMLTARSHTGDPGLDALGRELSDTASEVGHQASLAAAAVFAAAEAVVAGAQIDIVAGREAKDVADAAAVTEKSVVTAALMASQAASDARGRKADAAAAAAHELAATAAETAAGIRVRADTLAGQVAMAAVKAAEAVSASSAFGCDAEAALTALRLAATVDAAATATG